MVDLVRHRRAQIIISRGPYLGPLWNLLPKQYSHLLQRILVHQLTHSMPLPAENLVTATNDVTYKVWEIITQGTAESFHLLYLTLVLMGDLLLVGPICNN